MPFHHCGCVLWSDEWGFCLAWFLKAVFSFMSCRVWLTSKDNNGGGWEWDGVSLLVLYIFPHSQNHYPTFSSIIVCAICGPFIWIHFHTVNLIPCQLPQTFSVCLLFQQGIEQFNFSPLFCFLLILVPIFIFYKSRAKAESFQLRHSKDNLKARNKLFLLKVGCLW